MKILSGEKGPKRDIVLMNASVALMAADKVTDFKDGINLAEKSIDSGAAMKKLTLIKEFTSK